jgi:hypothetical protein
MSIREKKMNRDEEVKDIRPVILLEVNGEKNPIEAFMHFTLRPILKMQHDQILRVFRNEKNLNFEILQGKDMSKKHPYISQYFQKNPALRNLFIGMVIGQFTAEETTIYFEHQKAINKRIIDMLAVRFLSEFLDKTNL